MTKKKIKVLVVDDSYFMRKLIKELLSSSSDIEVIGEASDGGEAVIKVKELEPDVVTMDYIMKEMNGDVATEKILNINGPIPSIIMLSGYSRDDVRSALKSLRKGVVDFVFKPSGELSFDMEKIKTELILKVRIAAKANIQTLKKLEKIPNKIKKDYKESNSVVVIGSSTGGPPVLENIIASMPRNLGCAILVVQHMPEGFTGGLVDLLSESAQIVVKLAENENVIREGYTYVAPAGNHMAVELYEDESGIKKIIHLTREPAINGYRPSIDVLAKSVAEKVKGRIIGVILSGMGADGSDGMRQIKHNGGYVIAQSPNTAVVDSMPNSVKDFADEYLKPNDISSRIIELISKN